MYNYAAKTMWGGLAVCLAMLTVVACTPAKAMMGFKNEAVRYLERALEEGFKDRKRILDDPDFQKISSDPAFVALMKNPPVAIKD